MSPNRTPRRFLAVLALAVAVVAFPVGALAIHQYSDVPDSNPFHGDIAAITDAGVTFGCGGGNYCPSENVTREQMAAFMNRLGALSIGKTPVVHAATSLDSDALDGLDSTSFARTDVAYPGHYNCPGATMDSLASTEATSAGGNYMTLTSGEANVNCAVLLPDGAVVTSLKAGVKDNTATGYIWCGLSRFPLLTEAGGSTSMAEVQTQVLDTLGAQVLEDATIAAATIDNSLYSYLVDCWISQPGFANLTLAGVSIEYELTGIPMP